MKTPENKGSSPKPCGEEGNVYGFDAYRADFLDYLRALKRAPATLTAYNRELCRFFAWLEEQNIHDPRAVTRARIEAYMSQLTEKGQYKPQSLHLMLRAVRGFYDSLEKTGRLLSNPSEGLAWPKLGDRLPRNVLSPAEVKKLLNAPDTSNLHGIRNKAILEVLYSSGIRVGELCALTIYDVDLSAGFLRICHGVKGSRDRLVPIGHTARRYLNEYLRRVRRIFAERYRDSRKLFIGYKGGLSVTAVQIIVRQLAREAGLEKRVTPHCLRHTCATHMILEGADIVQVQRILGHADLNSTQIYTRMAPVDAKQEHHRSHPSEQQQVPRDFKPIRKLKPDYNLK